MKGVIINKKCNHPDFDHVCKEGQIRKTNPEKMPVYYGGPVLTNILGVLHTKEFQLSSTNHAGDQPLAFTLDRKMLENAVENVSSTNAVKEELTNCIYLQDSKESRVMMYYF